MSQSYFFFFFPSKKKSIKTNEKKKNLRGKKKQRRELRKNLSLNQNMEKDELVFNILPKISPTYHTCKLDLKHKKKKKTNKQSDIHSDFAC